MPRSTERHHRFDNLTFITHVLALHYGRHAVAVPDVDAWLETNRHRRSNVLLVVWDRTDAAILTRHRDDVAVTTAAPRLAARIGAVARLRGGQRSQLCLRTVGGVVC